MPMTGNEANPDSNYTSYSHGVYNRNSHGQEVLLQANNITWRLLGGSIDLYFFDGPTAPEVIRNYQSAATGFPAMQQYFAFGYHQCRWGYTNWSTVQEVVDDFKRFDIPLENMWTDIDYMKEYRDFEMDPNTFPIPEGQKFIEQLHANGQHYIPIVDSAIYIPNPENATDAYPTYNRGNSSGVFLRNPDGSQYIGAVWPGYTVFPDWHSDQAVPWWTDEMSRWHNDIPFDGIWIDMSEVSSFCVGSCGSGNVTLNPVKPPFLLPGEAGELPHTTLLKPSNVSYRQHRFQLSRRFQFDECNGSCVGSGSFCKPGCCYFNRGRVQLEYVVLPNETHSGCPKCQPSSIRHQERSRRSRCARSLTQRYAHRRR
jgi:alpha-glucosidase